MHNPDEQHAAHFLSETPNHAHFFNNQPRLPHPIKPHHSLWTGHGPPSTILKTASYPFTLRGGCFAHTPPPPPYLITPMHPRTHAPTHHATGPAAAPRHRNHTQIHTQIHTPITNYLSTSNLQQPITRLNIYSQPITQPYNYHHLTITLSRPFLPVATYPPCRQPVPDTQDPEGTTRAATRPNRYQVHHRTGRNSQRDRTTPISPGPQRNPQFL